MIITDFGDLIAERMRVEHRALAARWFERLLDLLPVDAREVFPTDSLLDHVPELIHEISAYLRHPEDDAIAANTSIMEKARELGALRHSQRASLHQVLREYHVLSGVLVTFIREEVDRIGAPPPALESIFVVSRVNQAINVLSQVTVEAFVSLYTQTISEQNERLEQFTRMAAHEWRQPLGALQFGIAVLRRRDLDSDGAERTWDTVERNLQHLVELTRKLEAVARMQDGGDSPILQEVSAGAIAQEAARQLRESAEARGVGIAIADDLPRLVVDVGRLELVFINLLSNAIKYSDPEKPDRHVAISGGADDEGWCRIEVRDNGIGIPAAALPRVFHRFTRVLPDRPDTPHVSGVGLGLAITEDCVRAMGGRIDVQSVEREGTVFTVSLPRASDVS